MPATAEEVDVEEVEEESLETMDKMDRAKRYAEIQQEIDELEEKIDKLEDEQDKLKPFIEDDFIENGIETLSTDIGTVYLHERDWASVSVSTIEEEGEETVEMALAEIGADDLMGPRVNTQSLSSRVNEIVEEEFDGDMEAFKESLSEEAREVIDTWTKHDVRVRNS